MRERRQRPAPARPGSRCKAGRGFAETDEARTGRLPSLRLRHGRRLASAALGITASSIWRNQLIKNEKKTKKKRKKPARPVAATAVEVAAAAATQQQQRQQQRRLPLVPVPPKARRVSAPVRPRPSQTPPLLARPAPPPAQPPSRPAAPLASPATSGWWGSGKNARR